jgi:hypothetical protein
MRAFLFLLLASCTHEIETYVPLEVQPARDLDILFVLDDSADRGSYDQMASQLDVLQSQLASVDGQLPSLHVGVVTTDLGVSGTLDAIPVEPVDGCIGTGKGGRLQTFAATSSDGFLEDLRGTAGRTRNFAGDLASQLGELTNPAAMPSGCEYEQPLEAMRRALDPATNPGFIRPVAMLAVVFLTHEDDCSLQRGVMLDPSYTQLGPPTSYRCTAQGVICDGDEWSMPGEQTNCRPREGSPFMVDVSTYKTFLDAYKPDRRDIIVSAVAGPRSPFVVGNVGVPVLRPSCQGTGGKAVPAVRIGALVDSFGGALIDSCTQDAAYERLTTPIINRQRSCFASLTRGAVDACAVFEVEGEVETEFARCADGDAGPCWYPIDDTAACPEGDHMGIAIKRGAAVISTTSRIEARCFVTNSEAS